jgi:murein DD-endopeptidase MepM/ murein hydrolase activator NlpD
MQQVSKFPYRRTPSKSKQRLLLLAALSLTIILSITLGGLHNSWAKASEVRSLVAANTATWQGGSFPVENFQAYTSGFGYRRSATGGRGSEFHRGLDLAAPDGSYIRNWWTGQVTKLSDHTACGTSIQIQSGDWTHIYCHLKGHVDTAHGRRYLSDRSGGILIWEGQQLPSGARIGRVGMTGRTTGPHLHWGIKYANRYIDPALVLQAMYKQQINTQAGRSFAHQRD